MGHNAQTDSKREKSVRKIVRLLIEHNGGNGEQVKKELDISYRTGYVWKGDEMLADCDEKAQNMNLAGEAANYAAEFHEMMKE